MIYTLQYLYLLNYHRFAGTVKVKGIEIFGGNSEKWPTKMKVYNYKESIFYFNLFSYVNCPSIDFTNVDSVPLAQEFNITGVNDAETYPIRYTTRAAKFFNVNNLTLLLEGARDGGNKIELSYLGFEGEFSQVKKTG